MFLFRFVLCACALLLFDCLVFSFSSFCVCEFWLCVLCARAFCVCFMRVLARIALRLLCVLGVFFFRFVLCACVLLFCCLGVLFSCVFYIRIVCCLRGVA